MKLCIRRGWVLALVAGLSLMAGLISARAAAAARQPNVLLILADDFGWTDLACYGSKLYETPNMIAWRGRE